MGRRPLTLAAVIAMVMLAGCIAVPILGFGNFGPTLEVCFGTLLCVELFWGIMSLQWESVLKVREMIDECRWSCCECGLYWIDCFENCVDYFLSFFYIR
jgi:hypothetical protein